MTGVNFFTGSHHWLVRLTMGRKDTKTRIEYTSACTANVFLTVQGTKGSSAPLLLSEYQSRSVRGVGSNSGGSLVSTRLDRQNKPLFSPGQTEEFEVHRL